jgi:O-antigen/teichoic acid export membrane protein
MAVGLGLVQLGLGAVGMIAGYGLGMAVAVVHGALSAQRGLPPRAEKPGRANHWVADVVLPMRSLSAPLVGLHLYTALVVNIDVLCARHYLSPHEAGIYGGSASIARIVLVGAHPLLLVLFSRLASMSAARSDTRRTLRLGALLVLGGLALSMLVPIFASDLVLRGFLGTAYRGASEILLFQWATAAVLIAQAFFAESMLATSNLRGGFLCVLPAIALIAGLLQWHDNAVMIARTCFVVCATLGSATFYLLWRLRTPLAAGR